MRRQGRATDGGLSGATGVVDVTGGRGGQKKREGSDIYE